MMAFVDPSASSDPLDRFLRSPLRLPRESRSLAKLPYCPYEVRERECRFLEIRFPFPEVAVCLPYGHMNEIQVDWRTGRTIKMFFARSPHPIEVKINGTELHDLYDALRQSKASAVAQFDPEEHLPLAGNSGPLIQMIALTRSPLDNPSRGPSGPA